MELTTRRHKAWVGDAVLSLYARQYILRERNRMDGRLLTKMTSNDFLATIGNPTKVEASIGMIYENEGLEAAFKWIDEHIMPTFLAQQKNRRKRKSSKS